MDEKINEEAKRILSRNLGKEQNTVEKNIWANILRQC